MVIADVAKPGAIVLAARRGFAACGSLDAGDGEEIMTSMLNRVSVTCFVVLLVSGGMASAQQADGSAGGDRAAGGILWPNADDRQPLRPFGDSGPVIRVYGAAQNQMERGLDPENDVYLYEPPLRLRVAADGKIEVRRSYADRRKVVFYLEGMNPALEERIQALLEAEKGIKVHARNVRPLQYTFIEISEGSGGEWRSRYPENDESLPAPQDWIPFEADFTAYDDGEKRADEFVNRLRDQKVEFHVLLGYGGREIVRNTMNLTTRRLIETSFLADLTGNGEFGYVTRNQIRGALAVARVEIQQELFLEDPDVTVPPLEWPERTWERTTVAWEDFLGRYLAETSRYDVSGGDLTPDRFTRFEEHLKSEMEDETKDHIDIRASMKAEASFLGIVDMGSEYGGEVKKEEFERRMRRNENGVVWEGEVFRPRSIDLFVMNASVLENEVHIGSYYVTARRGTAPPFAFTFSSRQRRSAMSDFPSGAVVAFDREDGCPPGWSEYRGADGRFIVGTGRHTVYDAYGNEVAELEFGREGGERTHRLSVDEMPSHSHTYVFSTGNGSPRHVDYSPGEFGFKDRDHPTSADGGGTPHNNMPPYIALRFCRLN